MQLSNSMIHGDQPDPLLKKAENLVQSAQVNAVTLFVPLLDRFPLLRQVDPRHWDYVVTVAGVFIAVTRLTQLRLDDNREERLLDVITGRLNQWQSDSILGFANCRELFESEFDRLTKAEHEARFVGSDALGKWIVLNVLGRPPQTEAECAVVRMTGGMVAHAFFDWWEE